MSPQASTGAMTVPEAAAWLGISKETVYKLCDANLIHHKRLGLGPRRRICIPRRFLEGFMASDAVTLEEYSSGLDSRTIGDYSEGT